MNYELPVIHPNKLLAKNVKPKASTHLAITAEHLEYPIGLKFDGGKMKILIEKLGVYHSIRMYRGNRVDRIITFLMKNEPEYVTVYATNTRSENFQSFEYSQTSTELLKMVFGDHVELNLGLFHPDLKEESIQDEEEDEFLKELEEHKQSFEYKLENHRFLRKMKIMGNTKIWYDGMYKKPEGSRTYMNYLLNNRFIDTDKIIREYGVEKFVDDYVKNVESFKRTYNYLEKKGVKSKKVILKFFLLSQFFITYPQDSPEMYNMMNIIRTEMENSMNPLLNARPIPLIEAFTPTQKQGMKIIKLKKTNNELLKPITPELMEQIKKSQRFENIMVMFSATYYPLYVYDSIKFIIDNFYEKIHEINDNMIMEDISKERKVPYDGQIQYYKESPNFLNKPSNFLRKKYLLSWVQRKNDFVYTALYADSCLKEGDDPTIYKCEIDYTNEEDVIDNLVHKEYYYIWINLGKLSWHKDSLQKWGNDNQLSLLNINVNENYFSETNGSPIDRIQLLSLQHRNLYVFRIPRQAMNINQQKVYFKRNIGVITIDGQNDVIECTDEGYRIQGTNTMNLCFESPETLYFYGYQESFETVMNPSELFYPTTLWFVNYESNLFCRVFKKNNSFYYFFNETEKQIEERINNAKKPNQRRETLVFKNKRFFQVFLEDDLIMGLLGQDAVQNSTKGYDIASPSLLLNPPQFNPYFICELTMEIPNWTYYPDSEIQRRTGTFVDYLKQINSSVSVELFWEQFHLEETWKNIYQTFLQIVNKDKQYFIDIAESYQQNENEKAVKYLLPFEYLAYLFYYYNNNLNSINELFGQYVKSYNYRKSEFKVRGFQFDDSETIKEYVDIYGNNDLYPSEGAANMANMMNEEYTKTKKFPAQVPPSENKTFISPPSVPVPPPPENKTFIPSPSEPVPTPNECKSLSN